MVLFLFFCRFVFSSCGLEFFSSLFSNLFASLVRLENICAKSGGVLAARAGAWGGLFVVI